MYLYCRDGQLDKVQYAVRTGEDVNRPEGEHGWTPLMWAINGGHEAIAIHLLQHKKTDPNKADIYGQTALHHAAVSGNTQILVHMLARPNILLDARTPDTGETPLMVAVFQGRFEAVRELLTNTNCDITLRSNAGKTAEDYAR